VLGGFAGTEIDENERNPSANVTILLSNGTGPAFYNGIDRVEADRTALLDGFTVRGANGNAAMKNLQVSPTIRNCRFDNNQSTTVFNSDANPLFENCAFVNNLNTAVDNHLGAPEFVNCLFTGNQTEGYGAAMNNSLSSPI